MKLDEINAAKHILLIVNSSTFANASALYTYILTLHKKISMQSSEPLKRELSFLPWFEKCRQNSTSNADLVIEVSGDTAALYSKLKEQKIKINAKMATALYAGLLIRYENFQSDTCDGTIFAMASTLIEEKADYKRSHEYLQRREALSTFRLRAKLFETLLLTESATHAKLFVDANMLTATGASVESAKVLIAEALKIVHVAKVTLYKSDENNKILKEID